jgi:hypothetical protein
MKRLLILWIAVGILVCFGVAGCGGSKTSTQTTTPETTTSSVPAAPAATTPTPAATTLTPAPVEPGIVTLARYNQIQNGMTYEQVVQIMNGPGDQSDDLGGPSGPGYTNYIWFGPVSSNAAAAAIITFQAGVVVGKAQKGSPLE